MRIAIPYENGQIFQHFGHTELFKLYNVEDRKIVDAYTLPALGGGHDALADFLRTAHVTAVICGGIGGGARVALMEAGIMLFPGVVGDADQAAAALAEGRLDYDPDSACHAHDHEGGCPHDCHGCH